jgi:hypothetical protein
MLFEIDILEVFIVESLAGISPNGLRDIAKRLRCC